MSDSSTSTPISRRTAPHYTWGDGCDGWHLVRAPGLSVIEERMPPGAAELRHRHQSARQFFFVLAGELAFDVEGRRHIVPAGAGVEVPPGAVHQLRNVTEQPATFLVVSQPPSHGDREVLGD